MSDGKQMERRRSNFQGERWTDLEEKFLIDVMNSETKGTRTGNKVSMSVVRSLLNAEFGNNRTDWSIRKRVDTIRKGNPEVVDLYNSSKPTQENWKGSRWSLKETNYLKYLYKKGESTEEIRVKLNKKFKSNRTQRSIWSKTSKIRSRKNMKKHTWTENQVKYMVDLVKIGTTFDEVAAMMTGEFGITRSGGAVKTKYFKETGDSPYTEPKPTKHNTHWNRDEEVYIIENMNTLSFDSMAEHLGRTGASIRDRVNLLRRLTEETEPMVIRQEIDFEVPRRWKIRALKTHYKLKVKELKADHKKSLIQLKKELKRNIKDV